MRPLATVFLAALLLTGPALAATTPTTTPAAAATSPTPKPPAASLDDVVKALTALHYDLYFFFGTGGPAGYVSKLDTLNGKIDALAAQMKAQAAATTSSSAAPAVAIAAPSVSAYFPPKPGDALFPSPEDSRMLRMGADVQGKPFLLDKRGSVHQLGDIHAPKSGYYINGQEVGAYGDATAIQLLVRGGEVYVQLSGGFWQLANPSMGNGLYNADLPPAGTTTTGSASGSTSGSAAAAPAPVAVSAVKPGSTGRILTVGQQCATLYACVKAAVDGDTIDGGGALVTGSAPFISAAVELRNFRMDCSSGEMTQGKGCLVNGQDVVYRNVEVFGAASNPNIDTGVGCIRAGGSGTVTIIGSNVHHCPQGVGGGGFPWALVMTDTHLHENGLGDGQTHNLYVTQLATKVTLTRVVSDKPKGGHAIKSRAAAFEATDCTFSADETLIDLPNGTSSQAIVTNTTLLKTGGSGNHRLIGYGEEGASVGTAGLVIKGGTVTGLENPFVQGRAPGTGTVTFTGTTFVGAKPTADSLIMVFN